MAVKLPLYASGLLALSGLLLGGVRGRSTETRRLARLVPSDRLCPSRPPHHADGRGITEAIRRLFQIVFEF